MPSTFHADSAAIKGMFEQESNLCSSRPGGLGDGRAALADVVCCLQQSVPVGAEVVKVLNGLQIRPTGLARPNQVLILAYDQLLDLSLGHQRGG